MPSLNLDLDYFDHPKTKRLIGLLGKGADVLPIRLWAYCGRVHAETGTLSGYSAKEIEEIVGWWGKSGESVGAMLKVRFLLKTDDGYAVHEWKEHEGHLWAFKVRGKKAAIDRWAKIAGECMTDASSMPEASLKQCPRPSVPDQPTDPPARGSNGKAEEIDVQVRHWLGRHPLIDYHAKNHAEIRSAVERHGWEFVDSMSQKGIDKGQKGRGLVSWIVGCADRQTREHAMKQPKPKKAFQDN